MSQEHLAGTLGISYQQLQRYESGKGRLPSSLLYRVATTLQVPVSYFFEQLVDCDASGAPDGGQVHPGHRA